MLNFHLPSSTLCPVQLHLTPNSCFLSSLGWDWRDNANSKSDHTGKYDTTESLHFRFLRPFPSSLSSLSPESTHTLHCFYFASSRKLHRQYLNQRTNTTQNSCSEYCIASALKHPEPNSEWEELRYTENSNSGLRYKCFCAAVIPVLLSLTPNCWNTLSPPVAISK